MNYKNIKKLFSDSSSIILIEKAGLLPKVSKHFQIITIPAIKAETLKKEKFDTEERYHNVRNFFLKSRFYKPDIDIQETKTDYKLTAAYLNYRERNRKKGAFNTVLLTDDKKIIKYLYNKKLYFINALLIPVVLYKRDLLNVKDAYKYLEILQKIGRYTSEITDFAWNALENEN